MTGARLAAAVAAWITLSVVVGGAAGGWSAAVQTFGLRVQPRQLLTGVLLIGALSVAALVGYAVIGAWAPLADELVWVGRDGGRLGSLDPVTTAVSLVRATLLAALGEELLFRGMAFHALHNSVLFVAVFALAGW